VFVIPSLRIIQARVAYILFPAAWNIFIPGGENSPDSLNYLLANLLRHFGPVNRHFKTKKLANGSKL